MSVVSKLLSKLSVVVISLSMLLAAIYYVPTTLAASATKTSATASTVTDPICVQPPSNVDHATFTDAEIDLYGLPHRAKGQSLEQWRQAVRLAKHRVCTGTVTNVRHIAPKNQTVTPSTINENSNIWAGNIATLSGYEEAVGQWNVPCLTLLLHDGGSSAWVGLGGDGYWGVSNLVQSGTQQTEYQDAPFHWTAQYFAWIQDYPWNNTEIEKFGVNCGDSMFATDWQNYDTNGNPVSANMFIEDETSGKYAESDNHNAFSDGSTAEWIIERNGDNGDLSDFNYINFTGCYAYVSYLNGPQSPISLPHNYATMYWNGHDLVSVGPLYADSSDSGAHFQMRFLHPS